jgi:hypothetical protein
MLDLLYTQLSTPHRTCIFGVGHFIITSFIFVHYYFAHSNLLNDFKVLPQNQILLFFFSVQKNAAKPAPPEKHGEAEEQGSRQNRKPPPLQNHKGKKSGKEENRPQKENPKPADENFTHPRHGKAYLV